MILIEYTYNKYGNNRIKKVKVCNSQNEATKFVKNLAAFKDRLLWRALCQSGLCKLDKAKQWPYKTTNKTQVNKYLSAELIPYSLSVQISHLN